MTPGRCLSNDI